MRTLVKQEKQLEFSVFPDAVTAELNNRTKNQKTIENRFPFLRVNCLQEVTFSEGNANQIQSTSISKPNISTIEGLTIEFNKDINRNFEKTYGPRQYVGKTIRGKQAVEINNTRRTPPPTITSFTADYGGTGGFFGKAQLTFIAHSMEQLEFLQPFLLTPGNTIFTEFGYSNTDGDINDKLFSEDTLNKFLEYSGVNAGVFSELNNKILSSNCNYEYFIGQIINFSINPTQTYGFECTVDMFAIAQQQHDESNPLPAEREGAFLTYMQNAMNSNDENVRSNIILFNKYNCSSNAESYFVTLNFIEKFLNLFTLDNLGTEFATELLSKDKLLSDYNTKQLIKYSDLSEKNELINLNTAAFNNKFIISKNSNVLIIKNEMSNFTKYQYDPDSGKRYFQNVEPDKIKESFTFFNIKNDAIIPINLESLETQIDFQPPIAPDSSRLFINDNSIKTIEEKIKEVAIIPRKYDLPDNTARGNIGNIYINYSVIQPLLQDKDTTNYDILKKIADTISYASGNVLDLNIIEKTIELEDENENENKNVNVIELVDYSTFDYNAEKIPYVFKFNDTESIITNYSFELGLADIEGNAVIANALGLTDQSNKAATSRLLFDAQGPVSIRDYFLSAESDNDNNKNKKEKPYPDSATKFVDETKPFEIVLDTIKFTRPPCESFETAFIPIDKKFDFPFEPIRLNQEAIDNISGVVSEPGTVTGQRINLSQSNQSNKLKLNDSTKEKVVNLIEPDNEHHVFAMNKLNLLDPQKSPAAANPILSPELNITLPGIGGITPTQYFDTEHLPEIYSNRGKFIILNVTHTVSPQTWTTQLQSSFRIDRQN